MERNTPTRSGDGLAPPVAAATKIELGHIVCANATGFAVEGSEDANLTALGLATKTVDNSAGADGDLKAEVGKTVYIEDAYTVSKTDNAGARSAAGKCVEVDDDGVWVEIR